MRFPSAQLAVSSPLTLMSITLCCRIARLELTANTLRAPSAEYEMPTF